MADQLLDYIKNYYIFFHEQQLNYTRNNSILIKKGMKYFGVQEYLKLYVSIEVWII